MAATVLIAISEAWFAASHFVPLIETITARGDRVVIATRLDRDDPCQRAFADHAAALGVEIVAWDAGRGRLGLQAQTRATLALRAIIQDVRPEVVHAIGQHVILVATTGQAARWRPPHLILHLTGRGILATARGVRYTAMRAALKTAVRLALTRGATLLVENADDARDVAGRAVDGDRVIQVVGAGVDTETFAPSASRTSAPPCRVTYVGRMLAFKGLYVLEDAVRILRDREVPVAIRCFGAADDNPDAIPADVLARWSVAAEADSDAALAWHGRTEDVADVWRASDIAVFPTLGGEGVPRSLLEAAATGLGIVASDVAGCRDMIRDGETGLLVPPSDARALANAIERLARAPQLREALGQRARSAVCATSSEAVVRGVYRDLYERVTAKRG
ncbi:MAG: glycosyltransferase [Pseudomonadota bacterium]